MPDTFERLKAALADHYAIERELGAGGMATVYLAEDLKHRRKVAVKVLRPELAAVIGPERFLVTRLRTWVNIEKQRKRKSPQKTRCVLLRACLFYL